jgi:hypothetical protein
MATCMPVLPSSTLEHLPHCQAGPRVTRGSEGGRERWRRREKGRRRRRQWRKRRRWRRSRSRRGRTGDGGGARGGREEEEEVMKSRRWWGGVAQNFTSEHHIAPKAVAKCGPHLFSLDPNLTDFMKIF